MHASPRTTPAPPRAPARMRHLVTVATVAVLFTAGAPAAWVSPAQAQLDECGLVLGFPECGFEMDLVEWNETGPPATILEGTLAIENTGQGSDSYSVHITSADTDWGVEVEPDTTDSVAPGETVEVAVRAIVPEGARVDDTTTITITVTSRNDDQETDSVTFDARSGQVFDWTIVCNPTRLTIQKGSQDTVKLTLYNRGNGRDQATVTTPPLPDGIQIGEIEDADLQADGLAERNVTIGVGIGLEEGEYAIAWDLVSQSTPEASDRCTTTLTAIVGEGTNNNGEQNENPMPVVLLFAAAAALVGIAARRRRERGT